VIILKTIIIIIKITSITIEIIIITILIIIEVIVLKITVEGIQLLPHNIVKIQDNQYPVEQVENHELIKFIISDKVKPGLISVIVGGQESNQEYLSLDLRLKVIQILQLKVVN